MAGALYLKFHVLHTTLGFVAAQMLLQGLAVGPRFPSNFSRLKVLSELAELGASASNTYKYQELSPSYQGSSAWGSPAELGAQATLQDGNTPNLCCLLWGDSFGSGRDLLT